MYMPEARCDFIGWGYSACQAWSPTRQVQLAQRARAALEATPGDVCNPGVVRQIEAAQGWQAGLPSWPRARQRPLRKPVPGGIQAGKAGVPSCCRDGIQLLPRDVHAAAASRVELL